MKYYYESGMVLISGEIMRQRDRKRPAWMLGMRRF